MFNEIYNIFAKRKTEVICNISVRTVPHLLQS